MIEFQDETTVKIEYEMTVPTEAYGNLKPKVKLTCSPKEAQKGLEYARLLLKEEYKAIKGAKNV